MQIFELVIPRGLPRGALQFLFLTLAKRADFGFLRRNTPRLAVGIGAGRAERIYLITKKLDELGLFIQQGARFDSSTSETFQLKDFFLIDEKKLGQIEDAMLPELFRSGALGLVYLHLASMGNMRRLVDRLSARSTTEKILPEKSIVEKNQQNQIQKNHSLARNPGELNQ